MSVQELIDKLSKFPGDMEVFHTSYEGPETNEPVVQLTVEAHPTETDECVRIW